MTRDDLILAVPLYEYHDRNYVCVEDVPEPWRQQFAAALAGSACVLVPGKEFARSRTTGMLGSVTNGTTGPDQQGSISAKPFKSLPRNTN